jgi:translation initiation factor 4G
MDSILSPTEKQKGTALVPLSSSSSETLTPNADGLELISKVESPSNGPNKPATSGTTAAPSMVPTGSGKLTADAPAFIPRRAPSVVVIKNTSGEEVDLRKLGAPTSLTATTSRAPLPKGTDEEEERKRKQWSAFSEVHRRAEKAAREKREEEKARKEDEATRVKAEEEAKRQSNADAEKEALMRRIREQEAELALLKAKLAAQSQPLQMQAAAVPSLQAAGGVEEVQERELRPVMSSTDDTGSAVCSENVIQYEEPEAEEEESQEAKELEKHNDWSDDHPHEVEHSYFPTTPGPHTAPDGNLSGQQQQPQLLQQVPGQPLQKMGRERSRRGGRRDRNRTANADKGEKGGETTDPLKLQKSRSHEPRRRPTPGKLDLTTMQRSQTLHPTLHTTLSSAKNITDIAIVVYPAGVRSPKAELNVRSRNGPFRCVLFSLCDRVVRVRELTRFWM